MGAEERSGEPPPDPARRLQPGIEGEADSSIAPISNELLVDLETDEDFTEEEREEERKANANLARRMADVELYNRLAAQQFTGREYEVFRSELAAYAFPVLRSWIRRGLIFRYCADRGRPPSAKPAERVYLSESTDDRQELAMETAAAALNLFRRHALLSGTWTGQGGASLKTFFVGACLCTFPNVFRNWQRNDGKHLDRAASYGLDSEVEHPGRRPLHPPVDADPADVAASRDTVFTELAAMPPKTREVAARIVLNDETFAEAGEAAGISERAVEGRLYRYRTEATRRREERDKR